MSLALHRPSSCHKQTMPESMWDWTKTTVSNWSSCGCFVLRQRVIALFSLTKTQLKKRGKESV